MKVENEKKFEKFITFIEQCITKNKINVSCGNKNTGKVPKIEKKISPTLKFYTGYYFIIMYLVLILFNPLGWLL